MTEVNAGQIEHPAVTNFRDYLRIKSVHPNVNYDECVKFLKKQANNLGLLWMVYSCAPGKPVVVFTWTGEQPDLPSLLLNSHMDVVPAYPEKWKYDPFAAVKDEQGNIYGRGAQDMKGIAIQYIEAVRRLIKGGVRLKRTVHFSFVPDEEQGKEGMSIFVNTPEFRALNVGCMLDEARATGTDECLLVHGERTIWRPIITCTGNTGHGSVIVANTAAEKATIVLNKFMEWRQKEKDKLDANPDLNLSDVTTVNLTTIKGGVQENVVPAEITLTFDVRLSVDMDHKETEEMIQRFAEEAGSGVSVKYNIKEKKSPVTPIDDSNPWWVAFREACSKMDVKLKTMISAGGSDSRYVRSVGIHSLGFSPMCNTPVLLHDNDEYLNEEIFLKGIDIYYGIIKAMANH